MVLQVPRGVRAEVPEVARSLEKLRSERADLRAVVRALLTRWRGLALCAPSGDLHPLCGRFDWHLRNHSRCARPHRRNVRMSWRILRPGSISTWRSSSDLAIPGPRS